MPKCLLCSSETSPISAASTELKIVEGTERFFRCDTCGAVSVPRELHLTDSDEIERYGLHDNSLENNGYRKYLSGVTLDVKEAVSDIKSRTVLDYGAGDEAVLTTLLKEEGIDCTAYDPNYESLSILNGTYGLIIACESAEHFRDPREEFARINEHLTSGGYLWIRTEMLESAPYFSGWWYKNDLTHIFFYSHKTMNYIAELFNWELVSCDKKNTTLFRKR